MFLFSYKKIHALLNFLPESAYLEAKKKRYRTVKRWRNLPASFLNLSFKGEQNGTGLSILLCGFAKFTSLFSCDPRKNHLLVGFLQQLINRSIKTVLILIDLNWVLFIWSFGLAL
jgi:hypothetical protein